MSADAKLWTDEDGYWHGIHDGDCREGCLQETYSSSLPEMIRVIEACGGYHYRWTFRTYPEGTVGLVGFVDGGSPHAPRA
jgi:hypothetical protein